MIGIGCLALTEIQPLTFFMLSLELTVYLKKAEVSLSDSSLEKYFAVESDYEIQLARKLIQFPITLNQTLSDLRPHFLSNYLFELAGVYNTFLQ